MHILPLLQWLVSFTDGLSDGTLIDLAVLDDNDEVLTSSRDHQ
jgi:hypothetical protein